MGKIKKIILINYIPFTPKMEQDFLLSALVGRGFQVEFWDISHVVFPKISSRSRYHPNFVERFVTYDDIRSHIANMTSAEISQTLFIPQMTPEWRIYPLLRALRVFDCKTAFFDVAAQPANLFATPKGKKLLDAFKQRKLRQIFVNNYGKILFSLTLKLGLVKQFDVIFAAGSVAVDKWKAVQSALVIEIHSLDYNRAISESRLLATENLTDGAYAVFLDEYLPFHPDFALFGLATVEATAYFKLLNSFFDRFESVTGTRVCVAAHPKAEYSIHNPFVGRRVFYGQTSGIVKKAKYVLAHGTTSIGYAVMFNLPLVLLSYKELEEKTPHIHGMIRTFSKALGVPIADMEHPELFYKDCLKINESFYSDYFRGYLSSFRDQRTNIEIITDFLAHWGGISPARSKSSI